MLKTTGVALNHINRASWSSDLAKKICTLNPKSVFEFGCNSGKNLLEIDRLGKGEISCYGVDINESAIALAQASGLRAAVGSEDILHLFPERSFDIAFTVSVLDHLPDPLSALIQLERISTSLMLLEPWMGQEGKSVKNYNIAKQEIVETTPFSYSWDYEKLIREKFPGRKLTVDPMPFQSNLGRYYNLYCRC